MIKKLVIEIIITQVVSTKQDTYRSMASTLIHSLPQLQLPAELANIFLLTDANQYRNSNTEEVIANLYWPFEYW